MEPVAERVVKQREVGGTGLESIADATAYVLLFLGGLLAIAYFVLWATRGWLFWGLIGFAGTLLAAFVQWVLLRSVAEHLRLQKKIAGFQFSGRISGAQTETVWICGNCGQMLHSEDRCDGCGARVSSGAAAANS